ncbi:toxin-antitoxin system, antitoxin component, ArsR domain protein [Necator americanus]|uniref:Toxin-antitoxin system, antitoxin component, ArsR domain protein n=1 Tax=Necator americanus TaxID=51031 RepID=W2T4K4_NECAM|nr:toxin-antitoxin system, antitoxin component, ArsR domain protein [Necator americanus]ETN76960.1 toxin-antitoxin system, antitoxin component, ArsR domain protein [Necator americanus]
MVTVALMQRQEVTTLLPDRWFGTNRRHPITSIIPGSTTHSRIMKVNKLVSDVFAGCKNREKIHRLPALVHPEEVDQLRAP